MRLRMFRYCGRKATIMNRVLRISKNALRMVHKMWRQDFKFAEFRLDHHTPEHFTRCFWQKSEKVHLWWVLYRLVMAVYFKATLVISYLNIGRPVKEEDAHKYWIFLTNWSYVVESFYFLFAFSTVASRAFSERKSSFEPGNRMVIMPWHFKVSWILQTIILPASVAVTGIFWVAVYDPERNPLDVINITTHVINSLAAVIDFLLVAQPYRVLHFYWPLMYSVLYLFFSLIYHLLGGTGTEGRAYIYAILDWSKPGKSIITCALGLAFLVFLHILFWLLHKLKKMIKSKSEQKTARRYKQGQENLGLDVV